MPSRTHGRGVTTRIISNLKEALPSTCSFFTVLHTCLPSLSPSALRLSYSNEQFHPSCPGIVHVQTRSMREPTCRINAWRLSAIVFNCNQCSRDWICVGSLPVFSRESLAEFQGDSCSSTLLRAYRPRQGYCCQHPRCVSLSVFCTMVVGQRTRATILQAVTGWVFDQFTRI